MERRGKRAAGRAGVDWCRLVDRDWDRRPALVRHRLPGPPVSAEDAFRAAAAACAPFRAGTRFRALPDARFFVEHAQIRAPGSLLPGPRDRDLDGYHRRVAGRLRGRRYQLFVDQPLLVDFPLWARVRDLVAGLLERVGVPVLPIACDLAIGDFARTPRGFSKRLHHSVVALVLRGRLRVKLWEELWDSPANEIVDFDSHAESAVTLEAGAGDILYWPARFWHVEECVDRARGCMVLRLWIPAHGARPTDAIKETLADLLAAKLGGDGAVPYLRFSPRAGQAPPLARAADGLTELSRAAELTQALRLKWAKRVSACGLEPVPAAREATRLRPTDLVRADPGGRAVRIPGGRGEWIWAINGHAFALQGHRAAERVRRALESGEPIRVGDLSRPGRDGASPDGVHALLELLHQLRAISVVGPGQPDRGG